MKLFLLVFLFCTDLFAAANFPGDVAYEQSYNELDKSPVLLKFDQLFSENHNTIKLKGDFAPAHTIHWADRVYLHSKGYGMVIVKVALDLNPRIEHDKIYAAGDDFLVHIKNPDGKTMSALYFSGYSEKTIRGLMNNKTALVPDGNTGGLKYFFNLPMAHASDLNICSNNLVANVGFAQSKNSVPITVLNSVINCLGGMLSGAWNATGGAVVAGVKGVFKAVSDPIQTFKDVKNSFSQLSQFVANFSKEMQKIGKSFDGLPAEIKSKIICEAGSTLGVGMIVGVITGGTGAALALKGIHAVISKVVKMYPNNAKLQALERETASIKNVSKEARSLVWGGLSTWLKEYQEIDKATDKAMIAISAGRASKDSKLIQLGLDTYVGLLGRKHALYGSLPGDLAVSAARTGGLVATGCTSIASLKKQLDGKMNTLKIYIDKQNGSKKQNQKSVQ